VSVGVGDALADPDAESLAVWVGVSVGVPLGSADAELEAVVLGLDDPVGQLEPGGAVEACAGIASTAPMATVPVATTPSTVAAERPVCLRRTTMRPLPCLALCTCSVDQAPAGHTGPP
jgi:hypothetical protein